MKNKFTVNNNPTVFEDEYKNQQDHSTPSFAKFEVARVLEYDRHTKHGLVEFNNSRLDFVNITTIDISPNDEIIVAYANNVDALICLGVYKYNEINSIIQYSPTFSATGLAITDPITSLPIEVGSEIYPTYNSWFTRSGNIVSFCIKCELTNVTNFGTGQYKLEIPYLPLPNSSNHFSGWVWDGVTDPDNSKHILLNVDHLPDTKTIDLHFLVLDPASPKPVIENIFKQGSPFTLTTDYKIFVTGTYITGEA